MIVILIMFASRVKFVS